jgi:Cu-Zn family superoxide dismutase
MKNIGFIAATALCLAAPVWAQSVPAEQQRKNAEQKTEEKIAKELKQGTTFAEATLAPKSGSKVLGTVLFQRGEGGLQAIASITGAQPGRHGIHIHEKGDCSAADAASAGGHFNPTGAEHSGLNNSKRHAGDLGNITAKEDGTGYLAVDIPPVAGFTNWDSIIGKSVVIHAQGDDMKTQPSGASGDRIACGVIGSTRKR